MTQQYYYSNLTGQQLDTALGQITQAATAAAAAEASAQEAKNHVQEAKNHAQAAADAAIRADGYSKQESDARFAPAILREGSGKLVRIPWAAPLPLAKLELLGITEQSAVPAPDAPVCFPEDLQSRVILGEKNLWNNDAAVIDTGGSCWTATDTGFQFRRGDYAGAGCVYVPIPIPKGQTLRFQCAVSGDFISCSLYGDGIYNNRLANGIKGLYTFTADRDYPNAVAALILSAGTADVDITDIQLTFGAEGSFTPGKPLQILETGLPLYGIPMQAVCQKHNYTDESGRKWFADEIDFARGVYIQRCNMVAFDGTEAWYLSTKGLPSIGHLDYKPLTDFDHGCDAPDNSNCAYHLCSHFLSVPYNAARPDGCVVSFGGARGNSLSFIWETYTDDLEGWKAWLAAQAAVGTPVTMVLGRKKPVETALSAEALEQFRAMIAYPGENKLYTDGPSLLKLSYIVDTGLYIDSKLAQLSAAILN